MDNPKIDVLGTKEWFDANGEFHRDDGPAWERVDGSKLWYQHGICHRDDGPAAIFADGTHCWHLHDQHLSFNEWLDQANISDEAKVMMKLTYG